MRVVALLSVLVSFWIVGGRCWSQAVGETKPKLLADVGQLLRDDNVDEAAALVRSKAAEKSPPAEVSQAMFYVAQRRLAGNKLSEAEALLVEITEKFPKSPATGLAWCGLGQIYSARRQTEQMVAALERGIAAPRAWTETNIMDASDTHGWACETLGKHYMASGQWAKALPIYTNSRPNSWCGTCQGSMNASRMNHILICQANLGRFNEACLASWSELANPRPSYEMASHGAFLLVRLYAEAEQLDDLRTLNVKLVEAAVRQYPPNDVGNQHRLAAVIKSSAAMLEACDVVRLPNVGDMLPEIAVPRIPNSVGLQTRRWLIVLHGRTSVAQIKDAAERAEQRGATYVELLAAIDTPAAREALVQLAIRGDIYRQQYVCGVIRHRLKDPGPWIAKIAAAVPTERARYTNWNIDPAPDTDLFYAAWNPPPKGSLPKRLPANLFEVTEKP